MLNYYVLKVIAYIHTYVPIFRCVKNIEAKINFQKGKSILSCAHFNITCKMSTIEPVSEPFLVLKMAFRWHKRKCHDCGCQISHLHISHGITNGPYISNNFFYGSEKLLYYLSFV